MPRRFDRTNYRAVFPLAARPTLRVGDSAFPVLDLSETGVRFLVPKGPGFAIGDVVEGHLILSSGVELEVEGVNLRVTTPQAATYLTKGMPFAVSLEQQRDLQSRFPHWIIEAPGRR